MKPSIADEAYVSDAYGYAVVRGGWVPRCCEISGLEISSVAVDGAVRYHRASPKPRGSNSL